MHAPGSLPRWLLLAALATGITNAAAEARLDPDTAMAASQAAIGRKLGDYTFTAAGKRQIRLADYRGKPLIVSFIYTGCTAACPVTTRQIADAVRAARSVVGADDFHVVSIGFNLPHDTPEAMRDHARRFGLDIPGWDFVSPQQGELERLLAEFGFSYVRTAWGFDHLAQVTVVDAAGRIYRQVYGDIPVQRLTDPLKELIEGTPLPRGVADFIDRVRILCTVYDPRTGRYRLDYALFIEIAAGLTILGATAWYLASEWRRQRRARPS